MDLACAAWLLLASLTLADPRLPPPATGGSVWLTSLDLAGLHWISLAPQILPPLDFAGSLWRSMALLGPLPGFRRPPLALPMYLAYSLFPIGAQLKGLGVFNPSNGMEKWAGPPKSSCMRRFEGPNELPNGMASGTGGRMPGTLTGVGVRGEGGVFSLSVKLTESQPSSLWIKSPISQDCRLLQLCFPE